MTDYARLERQLSAALHLDRRPVAIGFCTMPPDGVSRVDGPHPSGCSFWRLAADGQVFWTAQADHYNCPIGSYTHNVPLPPERGLELEQTLGLMTKLGYLKMEEVPSIPRLPREPTAIVYAPLGRTPIAPDVVLFSGVPGRLMLLHEAALRAGVSTQPALLGRPTCMALPATLGTPVVSSLGCIGNRVYTDLPDSDYYVAVAGSQLDAVAAEIETVVAANLALSEYHAGRRAAIGAA